MKLTIHEIKDRGTAEERLVLIANEDCDIGKYFAFVSKMNEGKIVYNYVKHPFWFPDKQVKKGDLIVLYTKKGSDSFKINVDGSTSHFYFRNLDNPILQAGLSALIIEANTWNTQQ